MSQKNKVKSVCVKVHPAYHLNENPKISFPEFKKGYTSTEGKSSEDFPWLNPGYVPREITKRTVPKEDD
jgi:hypothetical protein